MLQSEFNVEQVAKKLESEYDLIKKRIPKETGELIVVIESAYKDFQKAADENVKNNPNTAKTINVASSTPYKIDASVSSDQNSSEDYLEILKKHIDQKYKPDQPTVDATSGNSGNASSGEAAKKTFDGTLNIIFASLSTALELKDSTNKQAVKDAFKEFMSIYQARWEKEHERLGEQIEDLRDQKRKDVIKETQLVNEASSIRASTSTRSASEIEQINTLLKTLENKISELHNQIHDKDEGYDKQIQTLVQKQLDMDETVNENMRKLRDCQLKILKQIDSKSSTGTNDATTIKDRLDVIDKPKEGLVDSITDTISFNKSSTQADKIIQAYKDCIKAIESQLTKFFTTNLDTYIHDVRKKYSYVQSAQRELKKRLGMSGRLSDGEIELTQKYQDQLTRVDNLMAKAHEVGELIKTQVLHVQQNVSAVCAGMKSYQKLLDRDRDVVAMEQACDALEAYAKRAEEKLRDLYNNEVSIMDVIVDNNFLALYALKLLQYGLFVGAIFLTEKIFSNMYMQRVYANNGDPPSLLTMLGIFVAIDVAFALFLTLALYLVHVVAEKQGQRNFIINGRLVRKFIVDYVCATVVIFVLLAIIAGYMQAKKYFRYKTEGLRAIRAFGDLAISIAPVVLAVPFFAI
jgi:hypothetical protein